ATCSAASVIPATPPPPTCTSSSWTPPTRSPPAAWRAHSGATKSSATARGCRSGPAFLDEANGCAPPRWSAPEGLPTRPPLFGDADPVATGPHRHLPLQEGEKIVAEPTRVQFESGALTCVGYLHEPPIDEGPRPCVVAEDPRIAVVVCLSTVSRNGWRASRQGRD